LFTQVKPAFSADADPIASARVRDSNHVHFVSCDTCLPVQKAPPDDAARGTGVDPANGLPRPEAGQLRDDPVDGQRIA
jgi:hypothetical protein